MAVSFPRTLRVLRTDRHPWGFAGLTLLLVVPATVVWLFVARVTVYEVSSSARLEVLTAPQSVAAEVAGRVVESKLRVGLETSAGDVLVILDGESVRRSMEELQQQIVAVQRRLAALRKEIDAAEHSLAAQAKARELAVQESQAQFEVVQARARFAQQSLQRALKPASQNLFAAEEMERMRAEAEAAQGLVTAARLTVARDEQDRLADEGQRQAELAGLRQDAVRLEGDVAVYDATRHRLEHELELRTVRAYVSGRVEEVVPFRVGAVVRPAERLATIVPPGEPRIVALLPVVAVGRILRGQPARLRLDGFPWTQYGTLSATVSGVGNEPAEGLIRVELSVEPDPTSRIPLQHGQTGTVEVAVERASPATLILRSAGEYLMTRRPAGA